MFETPETSHRKIAHWRKMSHRIFGCISRTPTICLLTLLIIMNKTVYGELFPVERPEGMPVIQSLEVMCGKDHMDVHLAFSQPFEGIVSSKGQHGDPRCVYVPPSSGQTFFSFRIAYSRCGTKPDLHGQFYENTVVVQYDKDLLEVWDEAKRLRCEWFNDYEKTASKPPMVIADLDVVQLDFRGDNVDCWMEIQAGKGPWASPVSGIVPLGSTLTLVVAINDFRGEFDMRVKSCAASDGGGHVIQLSDEYGCVLRPKMISRFLKVKGADERATVITYAFFHAFKFPDALSVHIRCKVEICRHGCLDHCQLSGLSPGEQQQQFLERKEDRDQNDISADPSLDSEESSLIDNLQHASLMEDEEDELVSAQPQKSASPTPRPEDQQQREVFQTQRVVSQTPRSIPNPPATHLKKREPAPVVEPEAEGSSVVERLVEAFSKPFSERLTNLQDHDIFPHGPRNLGEDTPKPNETIEPANKVSPAVAGPRSLRKKRAVRNARSADVGVSGIYEVVSENDLAFGPEKAASVTVFSGKISEEVVYGICMPAIGFGALFASLSGAAIGAALSAGVMLQRLRSRRAAMSHRNHTNSVAAWMAMRILGSHHGTCEG